MRRRPDPDGEIFVDIAVALVVVLSALALLSAWGG